MTSLDLNEVRQKYKLGGLHHRMIARLSKNDQTSSELKRNAGKTQNLSDIRTELNRLARDGLVRQHHGDTWSITAQGLHASIILGPVVDTATRRPRLSASRICNFNVRELYDGRELEMTSTREGAYDAFLLPSLQGNQRVYRTGRKELST